MSNFILALSIIIILYEMGKHTKKRAKQRKLRKQQDELIAIEIMELSRKNELIDLIKEEVKNTTQFLNALKTKYTSTREALELYNDAPNITIFSAMVKDYQLNFTYSANPKKAYGELQFFYDSIMKEKFELERYVEKMQKQYENLLMQENYVANFKLRMKKLRQDCLTKLGGEVPANLRLINDTIYNIICYQSTNIYQLYKYCINLQNTYDGILKS